MAEASIAPLEADDEPGLRRAAELLVEGFRDLWPGAWPDLPAAEVEVRGALEPGKICLAARGETGRVIGWIGGLPQYARVWELHPLVVNAAHRGRGVGRALVDALSAEARRRGGCTLWLGTDDEAGMTSLSGLDLYPDVVAHLADVRARPPHPLDFYRRLGFSLAGVVPDANGPGRPDLLLARRLTRE